ncbi:MAG: hypothetical protein JXX29_23985 [Deltaproteobacteria bacterium]|nr:hypothetical protein [Deltaproteobacteria bacterium]MBN2674763.1 hypothetical protein [Deltaproteobacteria bacterium]
MRGESPTSVGGIIRLQDAAGGRDGGKAAGLAKLLALGLRVPAGFCVDESWAGYRNEINQAYQSLHCDAVAVRSSASLEDGADHSAAGQFESVLRVSGTDALFAAIEQCVSSLSSDRVYSYFGRVQNADTAQAKMTVIVQRMVQAKISGVLFTVEPQSARGESNACVVEACPGDGEQLVSGQVQAVQYLVDRETGELLSDAQAGSLLTPAQLGQLVGEALRAEAAFGKPLDLEWAIDDGGDLFWLQARPITTLFVVGANELDDPFDATQSFFTRANIGEMMPGATTPLTTDVFGEALNCGFFGLYGSCGALPKPRSECRFVVSFYSHLFIDLVMLSAIVGRVAGTSQEALEVSMFGRELSEKPPVEWIHPVYRGIHFIQYIGYVLGYKKAIRKLEKLRDTVHVAEHGNAASLYAAITDFREVYNRVTTLHMQVSSFSGALNGALREILRRGGLSNDEQMAVIASLLLHIEGIESAEIITSLEQIAAVAKAELIDIHTQTQFVTWLTSESADTRSPGLFADFLQKNGHRCVREAELFETEWKDDIHELAFNLWNMVNTKVDRHRPSVDANAWKRTVSRVCDDHPKVNRRALRMVAKRARDAVRHREYTKSILIQMTSRLRHAY